MSFRLTARSMTLNDLELL